MTRFTIVWLQSAQNDVAEIWQSASQRREIADATNRVDQELSFDPHLKSTYLSELLWRFDASPLRVFFSIRLDDRVVEVTNVVLVTDK